MKESTGLRIFFSGLFFIICMIPVVVIGTIGTGEANEFPYRIILATVSSFGAIIFACIFGFCVRKYLIGKDALKKKVRETIQANEETLKSYKSSLVAAAEDARTVLRTKDFQEKVTILEKEGLSKITSSRDVMGLLKRKVDSNPEDVKENLELITFGYIGEFETAISMLKSSFLAIEESSIEYVNGTEEYLRTLKEEIKDLADLGYKIDTGLEFFDADMLLQKAKSYLTEENYDPMTAADVAGRSTQLLELILSRYMQIEQLRLLNKVAIVDVAVKLESVNEQLVQTVPAELKKLKKYPESVWGKIAARISELQATDWSTDLEDRLREVIDLNTAMFLQPRLACANLEQLRHELSNILDDIDAPARLLQRLDKSYEDCLAAIDVIEESLPKIREDFLASYPMPAQLKEYDEMELMLKDLKRLAKEEKYSDWLEQEKKLNELMIAFSNFQLEKEKKAKELNQRRREGKTGSRESI